MIEYLIGAGTSLAASGLNAFFQSKENEKNREWTEEQNDLAYHRQLDMIDDQRNYDSPKNQMSRLMQAGLNPNLIYGQGGTMSPMQAQQAPNASGKYAGVAPQIDPLSASQAALNFAEIDRLATQNLNDTNMTQGQLKRWEKQNNVDSETALKIKNESSKILEETRNLGKQWILMDKEERIKNYEIQVKEKTWEKEVEDFGYKVNMDKVESQYFAKRLLATINNLDASTDLLKSQKSLTDEQSQLTHSQRLYFDSTVDDLVSIIKSQASQEDSMSKILAFQQRHTNNWEYWLNFALNLYTKSADRAVKLIDKFIPTP